MKILFEKFQMSNNLYSKFIDYNKVYIYNSYSKSGCYLSKNEWLVLKEMNGENNYYDLINKKIFALSTDGYCKFIEKLKILNLIQGYEIKFHNSIFQYKIKLFNPNDIMSKYFEYIYPVFKTIFLLAVPIFIFGIVKTDLTDLYIKIRQSIDVNTGIVFYIGSFIFLAIHELSHALLAKRRGGEIVEIGLMIYLFLPFIYVTVGSTNMLKTSDKILVAVSGVLSNMFFTGIFLLVFPYYSNLLLTSLIVSNLSQIIVNSNIFLEVDSYWALESYLGVAELYKKSHQFIYALGNKQTSRKDYDYLVMIVYGLFSYINFLFLLGFIFILLYQLIVNKGEVF
ncbi:hypothetical protein [Streptococcus salivarius]